MDIQGKHSRKEKQQIQNTWHRVHFGAKGAAKNSVSREKKKMTEAKVLDEGTAETGLIIQNPIDHFKEFGFYAPGDDWPERFYDWCLKGSFWVLCSHSMDYCYLWF